MYHSTREKLMKLDDHVEVLPAHGAGTLCGKGLSEANSSTIGSEKFGNSALQQMCEEAFIKFITADQPFVPKYFGYNVALNKKGAPAYQESLNAVKRLDKNTEPEKGAMVVDGRPQDQFKKGHIRGAINIQNGNKFETWLGSIVGPEERYYLVAGSEEELNELISKAAKIGYELMVEGAFVHDMEGGEVSKEKFIANPDDFTVVDIRNSSETDAGKFFDKAITIPLPELRERAKKIPTGKPVVVHCAGGYRSAAGSSLLEGMLSVKVMDMSEAVTELKKK